jgi:hypothetical protein
VEISGTRSSFHFDIIITEKALFEFVIWVNHRLRILLRVSLRALWVSHRPRILLDDSLRSLWVSHSPRMLLDVSLRSLSSRHLRGFIYNNFLFLLL